MAGFKAPRKAALARAQSMTPERRSEIAREAALGRWSKHIAKETHAGAIRVGDREIPCAVLSDGTRVLSVRGVSRALQYGGTAGLSPEGDGAAQLPPFLASASIKPYVSEELTVLLGSPLVYRPKHGGRTAFGYEATVLPDICSAILDARKDNSLKRSQLALADAAEALLRAFAKVGIVALVDEATGYQADRARDELQKLLDAYIVEEMRPWVKMFPDDFFRQTYRLHGWPYKPGITQSPRYVGKWINKYIYGPMPAPVMAELKARNPSINGRRKHKNHQFLTEDVGHPVLDRHVNTITTLMRASKTKEMFKELYNAAFEVPGTQVPLLGGGLLDADGGDDDDE